MAHLVIIGAGQAGIQTIISLRQQGYEGQISLIGDENYLPYQRPPLSKQFLAGDMDIEQLYLRPPEFYETAHIDLYLNCRAEKIDRDNKTVLLNNGHTLDYSYVMLSVGTRPRPLPLAGADCSNVFTIRKIDDIRAMQPLFGKGKKLVVIGGGYIGLEAAATAQKNGLQTTVIEAMDRVLGRVTGIQLSEFFQRLHKEEGVDIKLNAGVSEFIFDERVRQVVLSDGSKIDADIVVIGIGVLPNTEPAETAGLDIDNGIVVNEFAQTSDPVIYAAGDCTWHPNSLLRRHLRLENVQNAIDQSKTAAAHMLGKPVAYAEIPWFWSDQYDVKLQMAGLSDGHDNTIIRGDINSRSFALFYFAGKQLIAVDAVNRPGEFMAARKLIHKAAEKGLEVNPEKLADESIRPKEWLRD